MRASSPRTANRRFLPEPRQSRWSARSAGQLSGAASSAVAPSAPSSASSSSVAAIRRHKTATGAALLAGLLIVAAAVYGVYTLLRRPAVTPFQNFSITQLTNTGKVQNAAISPDGRFLLTVQSDNGNESLWLRNIPTGSNTQVLPASGQSFASLVFSPDGNSFYFRETEDGAQRLIFSGLRFSAVHPPCLPRTWTEARYFHQTESASCIRATTTPS